MAVEIFSREDFEAALPSKDNQPLWEYGGLVQGEHTYHLPVTGTNKRIVIRSSVGQDGRSAAVGQDSIRIFVQYYYTKSGRWHPLGKGQKTRYTTRVTGWQGRLTEALRDCWELAINDSKRHKSNGQPPPPQAPPTQHLETAAEAAQLERLRGVEIKMSRKDAIAWRARTLPGQEPRPSSDPVKESEPLTPSDPKNESALPPLPFGKQIELVDGTEEEPNRESVPTQKREPNPGQKEAIEAPVHAALRCLAGPGSGKTWTLENRVAFLLDHGVKPENLLAVTFSKPMADEMLGRIAARNPSLRGTAAEKQISTIHACCFRILRSEGDRRRVLDKDWMVKRILDGDRDLPSIIEEIWPYADNRPGWKDVYRWICLAKFYGLTTSEDLEFYESRLGYSQGSNLHEARRRFDQTLATRQGHPEGGQGITFPDMLLDVEVRLRRDRAFREKWQGYFKWVLIDEGQDTTAQAIRILATLAEPQNQVLIVGDADQLLYRFAGATPEANLYQGFEERYLNPTEEGQGIIAKAKQAAKELLLGDQGPGTVKLTVNYRSTEAIVEGINRLIAYNYADKGGPYEEQYRKELVARPGAPKGDPVHWAWFPNIEAESQSVADGIIEHLANGGQPGDIFVGTRTRAQLGYLEGPLVRTQVPFVNITGGSFWTSKHVADVVAYVRLAYTALHGRGDKDAFLRVYRIASNYMTVPWKKSPQYGEYANHRFLGRKFLSDCRESYEGAQRLINEWRYKAGVKDLVTFVQEIQADLAHAPNVGQVIQYVIEECYQKYLAHEEGTGEAEATEDGKLDDLGTVVDVASRFENVPDFLSHVQEMVRAAQAVKDKDWNDYVVLSTVHRLKGLERPVVFGPGWAEGYDEETGSPRGLLPHTFSLTPPPQTGPLPGGGIGRIEDERCIAFVLVSRAKSSVFLSGCAEYRNYKFSPSRFAQELGVVEAPSQGDIEVAVTDEIPVAAERSELQESTVPSERATLCVSTEDTEQANGIERPVSQEQAEGKERTIVLEQANSTVEPEPQERALINESTDVVERADGQERPSQEEQAEVPGSPNVIEPAGRDGVPDAEE